MKFLLSLCTSVLICTAVIFCLPLDMEESIYGSTLRLHILANSDTAADQSLKLSVRDAVLETVDKFIGDCENAESAEAAVLVNSDAVLAAAEAVIAQSGYDYDCTLSVGEEYYPERNYGDVILPAGKYCSVRLLIGSGSGQNWWCVLFPPLCTEAAEKQEEALAEAGFTKGQVRILTESERPRYTVKFKLLEILMELWEKIEN